MRKLVGMVLFFVGLAGCNHHYYRINGDTMNMYLYQPEAHTVDIRCSLDGYEVHSARKLDDGIWEVSLPAGDEFVYFYIVDDQVYVPSCRFREQDDFGFENCVFSPVM